MSVATWTDTIALPTYIQGPADPHASFDRQIYPYTMQDDLTHQLREVEYEAVHLESDLLHVIILPQLGGRVFSAYDKVAGREMFYRNNVVKPALVALRGAWISGGIEFNFFHRGHSHTTMAPVSCEVHEEPDEEAGASVTVSNIDPISGGRWAITLGVRRGDPRLHQRVYLRNRMPYRQRYYFWANAALPATDDLQLVYPAHKARFSREGIVDYPIWRDRDLSLYRNHPVANDIFTLDVEEDFFGCYYPSQDAGLVHLADHAESVGKKFFTWGTADEGMIWVDLLTDADGQYVELQAGRFVDQNTYEFMRPFQVMQWDEIWWPLHGIGGWAWASNDAVLNFSASGKAIEIGALTWRPHDRATIALRAGESVLWSQTTRLAQDAPFTATAQIDRPVEDYPELVVTIEVGGRELLRYVHPPAHTKKPSVLETGERDRPEPAPEDEATAGDLHLRAVEHELHGRLSQARRLCELSIERDPFLARPHITLGLMDYRAALLEDAMKHFEEAAAIDRHDHEAAYYIAVTALALGDTRRATSILRRLVALGQWRAEAAALLARIVGCETPAESPAAALDRPAILRDEPEQWLEVAGEYATSGCTERAAELLQEGIAAHDELASSPLVYYVLAHYLTALGRPGEAAAARAEARGLAPDGTFAWQLTHLRSLDEALQEQPDDWVALYLRGTLLGHLGRRDEAMDDWEAAAEIRGDYSPLLRNLAWGCWQWRGEYDRAEEYYRRAIELAPEQFRLYVELDRAMEDAGRSAGERVEMLQAAPDAVQAKWRIAARLVDALVAARGWDQALQLLRAHSFIPWEGARGMRQLWVAALLGQADELAAAGEHEAALQACEEALEYPRNIGVGRRAEPTDEAPILRKAAEIAQAMGDEEAAEQYRRRAEELAPDER